MVKKLKENKKKGFTLIELIVVLVILAILAALLIPALTGYIDKAKRKSIVAETRQVVMATQTLVDEAYAKKDEGSTITVNGDSGDVKVSDIISLADVKAEVKDITDVEIGTTKGEGASATTTKTGVVTKLTYSTGGKKCTYYADVTGKTTSDGNYDVK